MKIGYARVSILEQILDLRLPALKKAGCKKIFREKVSSASRERREFVRMLDQLREGDSGKVTIMIMKLSLMIFNMIVCICCMTMASGFAEPSAPERPAASREPRLPLELYIRSGHSFIKAPEQDVQVARRYPGFEDKGPQKDGVRITIMTVKTDYHIGEEVRVIHVLARLRDGELYVMGPKPIRDEYVDGKVARSDEPWAAYDGATEEGPGLDFNYDISTYKFDTPGVHTIQWKHRGGVIDLREKTPNLESNLLRISVARNE